MFGYEHERVCFARIGECDGGMSATIVFMGMSKNILSHTENILSHTEIYRLYGLVPRRYYLKQKFIVFMVLSKEDIISYRKL